MKQALKRKETNNKVVWAGKLLRSKNFVVVTDKESVLSIEVKDDINSILGYTTQRAIIDRFIDALTSFRNKMDKDMEKILGEPSTGGKSRQRKSSRKPTSTKKG